jgi:hypothetical protein
MKTMSMIAATLACVTIGSCTSAKSFKGPDGRIAYMVKCNGGVQDITACYARARKTCGGDYEVVNRDEKGRVFVTPGYYGPTVGTAEYRSIEVVCKSPSAPAS